MKKLKLQVQVSVDGFICGPDGEMDWMTWNWNDKLKGFVNNLTSTVDTIVMGKAFAQGFIPYWQQVLDDANHPERDFAVEMVEMKKVVFSKDQNFSSINIEGWKETDLSSDPLKEGIRKLKSDTGKDLIAYGGSEFVSSLISDGLIDELYLFINPVAIGKGKTIFHRLGEKQNFIMESATKYDCGIVVLKYLKQ